MHTFLIASPSKEEQEKEVNKLTTSFAVTQPDLQRVSPQNSIGIAVVRELKHMIALKPFASATKAVIIEEAQTLTIEAQNALLKTLEEPPNHTIIILLVSTNADSLLPTILSRCQVIQLPTTKKQLTTDEFSSLSSHLSVLTGDGVGKRMALAEEIAKDKQIAISWLAQMIFITRQNLIDNISKNDPNYSTAQLLNYVKSFQRAHTLLSTTNVNPRFTLEILFLTLPQNNTISATMNS